MLSRSNCEQSEFEARDKNKLHKIEPLNMLLKFNMKNVKCAIRCLLLLFCLQNVMLNGNSKCNFVELQAEFHNHAFHFKSRSDFWTFISDFCKIVILQD